MEFWKVRGPTAQVFVRFQPEDTLIFDLRYLDPEQYQRVITAHPEYAGIAETTGDHLQNVATLLEASLSALPSPQEPI